jgi:hypothetical protein
MASLNPTMARAAPADVDVELPVNGLPRELDLELLCDVGFIEGPGTVGADVGQWCLIDLANLLGVGRLAVCLGPVVFAGLAAGSLGLASPMPVEPPVMAASFPATFP